MLTFLGLRIRHWGGLKQLPTPSHLSRLLLHEVQVLATQLLGQLELKLTTPSWSPDSAQGAETLPLTA